MSRKQRKSRYRTVPPINVSHIGGVRLCLPPKDHADSVGDRIPCRLIATTERS
jgi:hypothetical protein